MPGGREATPVQRLLSGLKGETRLLDAGECLFAQGGPARAIYAVEQGELRLQRRTVDDRLVVLHRAVVGELLAEAALFAEAYHCEAVAVSPSRVRVLPKAEVTARLRADPDLLLHLAARFARQVQALRARVEARNIRAARQRVLSHLALRVAETGQATMRLDGPLQDLAAELGLTREALYRTLARLHAEGTIARRPGAITLLRPIPP
jgi:CRP-like cAMP-binding protein